MEKKNPDTTAGAGTDTAYYADLSAAAQRLRLRDALRIAPLSTLEARRNLDILHPAMRVRELRQLGYNIKTHWSKEPTECGRLHRVARYVLQPAGDETP